MPTLPLRIAVLECGMPPPDADAKYGGYGGIYKYLLQSAALPDLSLPASDLAISIFNIVDQPTYPSLDSIDAILITGSKHDSFANDPWILKLVGFTKQVLEQRRVRIIGVCFGHQIVGRAMGAKVGRSELGWEISVLAVDLTKRGQEIFGQPALALHQMHRDIVYTYPEGVEELAYTEKCAVQGMYAEKRLITVQGHPEFNEEIMKEILATRHKLGIFDLEAYNEACGRADKYHDGIAVGKAFLRFLLQD